jgi:hypothetical protein
MSMHASDTCALCLRMTRKLMTTMRLAFEMISPSDRELVLFCVTGQQVFFLPSRCQEEGESLDTSPWSGTHGHAMPTDSAFIQVSFTHGWPETTKWIQMMSIYIILYIADRLNSTIPRRRILADFEVCAWAETRGPGNLQDLCSLSDTMGSMGHPERPLIAWGYESVKQN